MEHLPEWMRKSLPRWVLGLGLIGLIVYALLKFIEFAVEAILEQEIQDLWGNHIRPTMLSSIEVEVPLWILLSVAALFVIAVGVVAYLRVARRLRWENSKLNPRRLRAPEGRSKSRKKDKYDRTVVIRGWYEVKRGRLSADDFAKIIQRSVNSGKLKPSAGAELLDEVGYVLTVCANGSHRARKRENGGEDED